LSGADIATVYTSPTTRTAATGFAVASAAACPLKVAPESIDAEALPAWLESVISAHADDVAILIVGHSNTVPMVLQALGADDACLESLGMTPHERYGHLAENYDEFWSVELAGDGCARIAARALSSP
jgi:phosphohistidine phosphatase SixA